MPKRRVNPEPPSLDIVNIVSRLHLQIYVASRKDERKISTYLLATATVDQQREVIEHLERLHEAMLVVIPEGDGLLTIVF